MLSQTITQIFPQHLADALDLLQMKQQDELEELRLHIGGYLTAVTANGDYVVPGARGHRLTQEDLMLILERAANASIHTALPSLRNGFLPITGGHRLGVCGTAVMNLQTIGNFRDISSLNLRIAKQMTGIGREVLPSLLTGETLASTLIISPPGMGKTTLLRDILRAVSEGEYAPPMRVGVADERGELCAMVNGEPQMDIGRRTDVMDGCPKAMALMMLLRGMNPEVLVVDEITIEEDIEAIEQANGCGVTIFATAHAASYEELCRRPLYKRLLEGSLFQRIVVIERRYGRRQYMILDGRGEECFNSGAHSLSRLG